MDHSDRAAGIHQTRRAHPQCETHATADCPSTGTRWRVADSASTRVSLLHTTSRARVSPPQGLSPAAPFPNKHARDSGDPGPTDPESSTPATKPSPPPQAYFA